MATKTFKVALSLDNPRLIQTGISVQSFDRNSVKISISLTKDSQAYKIPTGASIKISLFKVNRQEQKIIADVPNNSVDSIDWIVPDYLDGYSGTVRCGVYLINGAENVDLGYFSISSNVSDIDKAAEEFTDDIWTGWQDLEDDLAEFKAEVSASSQDVTTAKDSALVSISNDVQSAIDSVTTAKQSALTSITQATSDVADASAQFTADLADTQSTINAQVAQANLDLADDLAQVDSTIENINAKNTQVNTLASDFTADVAIKQSDVTSKYNAFNTSVTQAGQTIDGILGLADDVQQIGVELNEKANKIQEDWITPTLLNGWITGGNVFFAPIQYKKDEFGFVHLRGGIHNGVDRHICTLPIGYRPKGAVPIIAKKQWSHTAFDWLALQENGTLSVSNTSMPTDTRIYFYAIFLAEN